MSGTAKNVGMLHDKITGSEGRNEIERLTKNPALEKFNLEAQGDYTKARADSQAGLEDYIRNFLAGTATATARSAEEQAAVDRYYNGDVERSLAALRAQRTQAGDTALDRALRYATRSQSMDRLRGGGPSSYDRRIALNTGADLTLANSLANLERERADAEYIRQNQLGLAGRRTAMADALAGRAMIPGQARQQLLGWENATIGALIGNDAANNMYGVKYIPSAGEQITEVGTNLSNDLQDAVAMYGSLYGGQGPQPHNSAPVSATNFGATQMWSPGVSMAPAASSWGAMPSVSSGGYTIPPMGNMYSSIPYGYSPPPNFGAAPQSAWSSPAFAAAFGV